jgi:hypothetical protein
MSKFSITIHAEPATALALMRGHLRARQHHRVAPPALGRLPPEPPALEARGWGQESATLDRMPPPVHYHSRRPGAILSVGGRCLRQQDHPPGRSAATGSREGAKARRNMRAFCPHRRHDPGPLERKFCTAYLQLPQANRPSINTVFSIRFSLTASPLSSIFPCEQTACEAGVSSSTAVRGELVAGRALAQRQATLKAGPYSKARHRVQRRTKPAQTCGRFVFLKAVDSSPRHRLCPSERVESFIWVQSPWRWGRSVSAVALIWNSSHTPGMAHRWSVAEQGDPTTPGGP